jgi:2-amino-4-hydroxy-6-hydroxymethyldihydropteridine diphosphokinase
MGESAGCLAAAREALTVLPGVAAVRFSSVYRTEPQGFKEQPFFLNQVGELLCLPELTPEALLNALLATETVLGRERAGAARFGPRAIDLDLLLFANERMTTPRLSLPHPRMLERAFVLLPLAELAPELRLPQGMAVREALRGIRYRLESGIIFQVEA